MTAEPVRDDELGTLLGMLARFRALVLAVSGGPDSTALMHLVARWRAGVETPPALLVATVDHRLRPESGREAAEVARQAAQLGLPHRTLVWEAAGARSGLQAAAREARYGLLAEAAADLAAGLAIDLEAVALVTAHTRDDQAETVLMRLLRGSGVDGLAGIPPEGRRPLAGRERRGCAVAVCRPLLELPKVRLLAVLEAGGIPFADDPSNRDARFERVRMRKALARLDGLGLTSASLARTAARMRRARTALDAAVDRLLAATVTNRFGLVLDIAREPLAAAPDELAVRLLRRVLAEAGGDGGPADLASIEALQSRLGSEAGRPIGTQTLGGSILEIEARRVRVYRESGRGSGLPRATLRAGEEMLWDGRFVLAVHGSYGGGEVEIGPLGGDDGGLKAAYGGISAAGLPIGALLATPAFRAGHEIIAVPLLVAVAQSIGEQQLAERLTGPRLVAGDAASPPLLAAHHQPASRMVD